MSLTNYSPNGCDSFSPTDQKGKNPHCSFTAVSQAKHTALSTELSIKCSPWSGHMGSHTFTPQWPTVVTNPLIKLL